MLSGSLLSVNKASILLFAIDCLKDMWYTVNWYAGELSAYSNIINERQATYVDGSGKQTY